jgi:glycosyltransferase involved in cell wall biosynthesis
LNKRILIITQYFPPEVGGGSQRSIGFAEELRDAGFKVTVISPFPSYLIRKEDRISKFKLYEKSLVNGITLFNTFVYASDRGSFVTRILYYLSFSFSSTLVALLKVKRTDFHLTISPPLFNGISGMFIKIVKGSKFIFDIGDLWPESAIQLGFLKNKTAIYLAEKFERLIYKKADYINVVTEITKQKLSTKFKFIKKIIWLPNFVRTDLVMKKEKNEMLHKELNLDGKFIVGYAGNIGGAQGLKLITDSAKLTKHLSEIIYLVIGDGVDREILEKEIQINELKNVLLLPPVNRDLILDYLSLFDVTLIPLVKNELFKFTIPSKLYEAMASECPVILCVDGEARKILEKSGAGLYCEPENSTDLVEKILWMNSNKDESVKMGKSGRKYAVESYDRKKTIERFAKMLKEDV